MHVCMCVHAFMCMSAHMSGHECGCLWTTLGVSLHLPLCLIQGLLFNTVYASWLAHRLLGTPLSLPTICRSIGITEVLPHLIYVGFRDSNLGLHICMASAFPTEPSLILTANFLNGNALFYWSSKLTQGDGWAPISHTGRSSLMQDFLAVALTEVCHWKYTWAHMALTA